MTKSRCNSVHQIVHCPLTKKTLVGIKLCHLGLSSGISEEGLSSLFSEPPTRLVSPFYVGPSQTQPGKSCRSRQVLALSAGFRFTAHRNFHWGT